MELRHLRYFVAVAEERGFGRASRRLRVAQQALSRQIADLEREVGALLLTRVHAGAHLTPAGAQFFDGARRILAAAERTAEQARRTAADGGAVRVGSPDVGAAVTVLRETVASFRAWRPDTPVVYDLAPPAAQQARLRAGTLDVGFEVLVRLGEHPQLGDLEADPEFRREWVASDALSAVMLPTSHALAREPHEHRVADGPGADDNAPIECADLSGLPLLVARAASPDGTDAMVQELRRRGWRGAVECVAGTAVSLAALVAAGAGWLIAPRSAHEWAMPGAVQREFAGGPVGCLDTCAIWRNEDGPPATGEFLDVLRAHARAVDACAAQSGTADDSVVGSRGPARHA